MGLFGLSRRTLRSIWETNAEGQGIVRYQPSQIEAFIDDTAPLENMLFSGGMSDIRTRAIARAVECAYLQGYSVLILHCGNQGLERGLDTYLGPGYLCAVNRTVPIYDPFCGASNDEISSLILSSSDKVCRIGAAGRYYIEGITEFIKAKGINPYCRMYITCPYQALFDKINDAEASGKITPTVAQKIISQIMQGKSDQASIENYFSILSAQADLIMAKKSDYSRSVNLSIAMRNRQILSIDVQSSTNSLLISLLVSEAATILAQGQKLVLAIDGIQLSTNDTLKEFIKLSGRNYRVILSSDDVYSDFGGAESDFFSFAGKCSTIVLSRHSSAYSCQKFSDILGFYDKQEITPLTHKVQVTMDVGDLAIHKLQV